MLKNDFRTKASKKRGTMSERTDAPKVFISYSWKPEQHKKKVIKLAERLMSDGIEIVIDVWNLDEGQDKYKFMEKMVNDPEIKKVLLLTNSIYTEKANKNQGGVGTESLIISSEIYEQAEQKKFIPVVTECDSEGKPFLPTFIKSRIFIDLSNPESYEVEYEKLIRNIFGKPTYKRPPLGNAPPYITEDEPVHLRTSHKVKQLRQAFVDGKPYIEGFINDYLQTFHIALEDFRITEPVTKDYDEHVLKNIYQLKGLRDDYINFLRTLFKFKEENYSKKFHSFFEKLLKYIVKKEDQLNIQEIEFDNYRFFFYELFLYHSCICIQFERFELLSYLISEPYLIYQHGEYQNKNFAIFNKVVKSLNNMRNDRLNMNRVNIAADTIKKNADNELVKFAEIKETDLLLYYISLLNSKSCNWFPQTSVYYRYGSAGLRVMKKAISKRYFNKIKILFGVDNEKELKNEINKIIDNGIMHNPPFYEIPNIITGLNLENIAKY